MSRVQMPQARSSEPGVWGRGTLSLGTSFLSRLPHRSLCPGLRCGAHQAPRFHSESTSSRLRRLVTQLPSSREAAPGPPASIRVSARPAPAAPGPDRPEPPPGECAGCAGICVGIWGRRWAGRALRGEGRAPPVSAAVRRHLAGSGPPGPVPEAPAPRPARTPMPDAARHSRRSGPHHRCPCGGPWGGLAWGRAGHVAFGRS